MKNDCPILFLSYKSLKSIKNESKGAQDSFILLYAYFDSVTTSGLSPKTKRCMNTCPFPNIPSPGLSGSLSKSVFHLIGKIQNRISELVHCVLEMGYALKGNISQY